MAGMHPPNFAAKQHDDAAKSTCGRRHLNFLIEDYCKENQRVYGATGKTGRLKPPSPETTKSTAAISTFQSPSLGEELSGTRATFKPAYQELSSGRAKEVAMQVNNRRTPTGCFFSPVNPVLVTQNEPENTFNGTFSVQDAALDTLGVTRRSVGEEQPQASAYRGGGITASVSTTERSGTPSWLMPWQTGDRDMGRRMADAINSKRTPIGAFANFDLAKAVK